MARSDSFNTANNTYSVAEMRAYGNAY